MKKITALFLVFALFLLSFCGCKPASDGVTASPGEVVDIEKKKEITNLGKTVSARPVAAEETDAAFSTAQWKFGLNLFAALSKEEQGNLLVSPYSVAPALGMTANGAAGETQSQMLAVLGGLSAEELNRGMAALRKKEGAELKSANSVWFRDAEALAVHSDFLQTNADYYGAEIYKAPFTSDTADAMNGWVKEQTDGMIPEIIQGLEASTMLYLINALAFEAEWAAPLDPAGDGRFENCKVPVIAGDAEKWLETSDSAGFLKQYKGGHYSFGALMPREGMAWDSFLQTLTPETVVNALQNAEASAVQLKMPKFSYDFSSNLRDTLSDMGMENAFYSADFSAMADCTEGPLYIGQVIHKTFIELDENGTRAAAATGVQMDTESAVMYERQITLDRPFVYFIVDNQTGVPVFIGSLRHLEGEELPPKETPETTWLNEEKTRGYRVEEGICYITENGGVSYRMGTHWEEAVALAEQEAANPKYQYQDWESVFEKGTATQPEMLRLTEEKYPCWEPEWGGEALPDRLVWAVRLFDKNDPLTCLYLYVDVYTGEIKGGGALSD